MKKTLFVVMLMAACGGESFVEVDAFRGNNMIKVIDLDTFEVSNFVSVDAPQAMANLDNNLYIAGGHQIYQITLGGKRVVLSGSVAGFQDGYDAKYYAAEGIDVFGNTLVIADGSNGEEGQPYHRIRILGL